MKIGIHAALLMVFNQSRILDHESSGLLIRPSATADSASRDVEPTLYSHPVFNIRS
jgi:hypothetical protein